MWEYSEKVREHYLNPHNVGEIENADGVAEVGNVKCGDALRLTFTLDNEGRIDDIKFRTFGCGSAIAASSMLTEMCKGKTLEEAERITNKQIAEALGGLPAAKMHCSVMGQEALGAAIKYYRNGRNKAVETENKTVLVCTCFNVSEDKIEKAIRENKLTSVQQVTNYTKAGGGCGGCHPQIQEIIDRVNKEQKANKKPGAERLHMAIGEKIDKIRNVLDKDIRPLLQRDGGDCEFVKLEGNTVYIKFTGMCEGCAFASMTQAGLVEDTLKKKVSTDIVVKHI